MAVPKGIVTIDQSFGMVDFTSFSEVVVRFRVTPELPVIDALKPG